MTRKSEYKKEKSNSTTKSHTSPRMISKTITLLIEIFEIMNKDKRGRTIMLLI